MHASRWGLALLLVGGMIAALSPMSGAGGDQNPAKTLERSKLDAALYQGLKTAINQGVDLYNAGDPYGCYRLFQGIILNLRATLADRPDLQRILDRGLADAESQSKSAERAWTLRGSLLQVRSMLRGQAPPRNPEAAERMPSRKVPEVKAPKVEVPEVKVPKVEAPPVEAPPTLKDKKAASKSTASSSLWERLGGRQNVAKIIDDFTSLAAADPKVDFTRNGKIKLGKTDFKQEMIDFVSSVTGGPLPYLGKSMKEAHKGMKITDAQFDAAAADLKKALQDNNVKSADVKAMLDLVETTRTDIVEAPAKTPGASSGSENKAAPPKSSREPSFEEIKTAPRKLEGLDANR